MIVTRRRFLAVSGATVALAGVPGFAFAQASPEAVLQPGVLPDHFLGKADAPVSLIEYASMTCPHCASFHSDVLPKLKSAYIETGKLRYALRDFPLDLGALAGTMLARCAAGDEARIDTKESVPPGATERYYMIIGALFEQQASWATAKNLEESLFAIVKQLGFTQDEFKKCLSDEKLYKAIEKERERANKEFEVRGTPTFFVNGKRAPRGTSTFEEISKLVDAEIKS